MRDFLMGLGAWAVVGCVGSIDPQHTPVTYQAVVDTDWSPEQQQAILDGLDFWQGEVGDWVTFEVTIAPCDESLRGCIAAVGPDNWMLQKAAETNASEMADLGAQRVVGVTHQGAIALDASFARMGLIFRHEWGHRLGLVHADGGVMAPGEESTEITDAVVADLAVRGLR